MSLRSTSSTAGAVRTLFDRLPSALRPKLQPAHHRELIERTNGCIGETIEWLNRAVKLSGHHGATTLHWEHFAATALSDSDRDAVRAQCEQGERLYDEFLTQDLRPSRRAVRPCASRRLGCAGSACAGRAFEPESPVVAGASASPSPSVTGWRERCALGSLSTADVLPGLARGSSRASAASSPGCALRAASASPMCSTPWSDPSFLPIFYRLVLISPITS